MKTRALVPTASRQVVDLLDLRPCQVTPFDVASGLAFKFRWSGQITREYSIAEHTILGRRWLRDNGHPVDVQFDFLNHDDDEFLPPDLPAPLKLTAGLDFFHGVQRQHFKACAAAFGFSVDLPDIVKTLDIQIRADEFAQLYPGMDPAVFDGIPSERLGIDLQFWRPVEARDQWLLDFDELVLMRQVERALAGGRPA